MTESVVAVHLFPDGDEWLVSCEGAVARHPSRADAFAAAKDLARARTPSRLVLSAPPGAPVVENPVVEGPRPQPTVVAAPPIDDELVGEVDWTRLRGPIALGRSVVVATGQPTPPRWEGCGRVALTADDLSRESTLEAVRRSYLDRIALVYEVDATLPAALDESVAGEPWNRAVGFEFTAESARHYVFANAVDARDPERPRWPWAALARAAGATLGASADVTLADGRAVWCDGGPLRLWSPDDLDPPDDVSPPVVVSRVALERELLTVIAAATPTAELAPDQLAAVTEGGGGARIIAPAGSGKTRVLTERARHLVRCGVPVDALCLVAFNKRAQLEMAERTADLPGLQIQTLNALALAVVNGGRGFRARDARRVTTIDEVEVRNLLAGMVQFPRRANTDPAASWLDALSAVRLGLRDPAEVEAELNGEVDGLAEVFPRYREALRTRGQVDFDEQIYLALETLLSDPESRRAARHTARVLLVDEFQDLTPAHLLLIRLLAGPDLDVFGVGDDDQTIYGYSGASPDWLVHFDRYFPGANHHALEVNYRCPEATVAAATNLLSHNEWRVTKAIRPGPAAITGAAAVLVDRSPDPVRAAAARVRALVDGGVAPSDIVVLTRVNALLAPVQAALHLDGIAVDNREGVGFLQRTGVAAALSWLRIATSAHLRGEDTQRAARRPGRSLSPKVIEWMAEQSDERGLERLAARLKDRDKEKVLGFSADIQRIRRLARAATTAEILTFVRADIGLDQALQTLDAAHRGRNSTAHSDDLRAIIALGSLHPEAATFDAWLGPVLASGRDPAGVQLSTVHRVKGLEWPHVIVHDATQGVFPHRLSTDIEEERRVFHVAITRCQESVLITAEAGDESMFLSELTTPAPPRPPKTPASSEPAGRPASSARSKKVEIPASVGLQLEWGGYEGAVVEVRPDGVLLLTGGAKLGVAYGSAVTAGGRRGVLAPPATGKRSSKGAAAAGPSENPDVFEALRTWRLDRSKQDAVPAFVVAADRTLREIADRLPRSLDALLGVHGLGPTKLERYGDEILAVIDTARPPDTTA